MVHGLLLASTVNEDSGMRKSDFKIMAIGFITGLLYFLILPYTPLANVQWDDAKIYVLAIGLPLILAYGFFWFLYHLPEL